MRATRLCVPERHPRPLGLQLVQQTHHVVRRELHEDGRHLVVERVAQLRFELLERADEPLLLTIELPLRDDAVGQGARERLQLAGAVLKDWMFCLFVEPTCFSHVYCISRTYAYCLE